MIKVCGIDDVILSCTNSSRMGCAGYVIRMGNDQIPKRLTMGKPDGTRSQGRPKKRWLDSINAYMNAIGVRNWREVAIRREEWRKTQWVFCRVVGTTTHTGL
ncbi:hypothetical protein J437_LFUL011424 [Ladona fulva]|uniref:Uncharacterized protein n=1 Tax=Ladona fulva TaxID=123851 RepID=A0A8K0KNM1_LADFU|nr:hypothetical protein J437_LFUL011424 [Ladona fulva]